MHTEKEKTSWLNQSKRPTVRDFELKCRCWQCLPLGSAHYNTPLSEGQSQNNIGGKSAATQGHQCTDLLHSWQQKKIMWIKPNSLGTLSKLIISKLLIECELICLSKCQCKQARGNTKRPEEYLGHCLLNLFLFWSLSSSESREQLRA